VLPARKFLQFAGSEVARLLEQLIDQRRLAVVDVRDDRHVSQPAGLAGSRDSGLTG
jgi:hypothetical protein